MKMSDVFEFDRDVDPDDMDELNLDQAFAAAHAINCHDELVEALSKAFVVMTALQEERGLKPTEYLVGHEIKAALAKAKG